jgi:GAF domain-containing protein
MNQSDRTEQLFEAFAEFADTLVSGYDVIDFLQQLVERCQQLLDVDSAGILLAGTAGILELVASTSEENTLVEVMQLGANAGPSMDSYRTKAVVSLPDVEEDSERWSDFASTALSQGIHSVYAIPLRLRDITIGTLSLMRNDAGELNQHDIRAAQALADVATIGILQERAVHDALTVRDQLQSALTSRIIIEQAKGVVAESANVSMEAAFNLMRHYSRSNQRNLTVVARQLVDRQLRL